MANDGEIGLDTYLEEVKKVSGVLKNEDELIDLARSGNESAQKALIEAHLASAAELRLKLAPPGMPRLTAIQEAI